jgi:hypothetical protein
MKLQRTTLGLLAIAALSLGGVYWVQSTSAQRAVEQEQQQNLFTFAEADVQTLSIETPTYRLRLKRQPISTDAKALPTVDQWTMTVSETASSETASSETANSEAATSEVAKPGTANSEVATSEVAKPGTANSEVAKPETASPEIASDAAVAYLLNTLSTLKGDRSLVVPQTQLAEYGLSDPEFVAIVTIQPSVANGQSTTYRLELGKAGFTDDFIYIRLDPEPTHLPELPSTTSPSATDTAAESTPAAETTTLFLVPKTLEYAMTRPLSEWRSPDPMAPDATDSDLPDANTPEPDPTDPTPTNPPE